MWKKKKIKDRVLPAYTRGEEIFNMVSHIVGGAVGVATLALGIVIAALHGSVCGVLCSVMFGVSMTALYTVSSIYHGLPVGGGKKVFRVLDHCTIYFLIAGTYTPILLCALRPAHPVAAWVTFGVVWGLAVLAITLNAIDLSAYRLFSMICYVGMGWAIVFTIRQTFLALGLGGFILLLSGGIAYTAGIFFYQAGKQRKYFHSIFHLFALAGSVTHALCILLYVL